MLAARMLSNLPAKCLTHRLNFDRLTKDRQEWEGYHHYHADNHAPSKSDPLDHDAVQQGAEERTRHPCRAKCRLPCACENIRAVRLFDSKVSCEGWVCVKLRSGPLVSAA